MDTEKIENTERPKSFTRHSKITDALDIGPESIARRKYHKRMDEAYKIDGSGSNGCDPRYPKEYDFVKLTTKQLRQLNNAVISEEYISLSQCKKQSYKNFDLEKRAHRLYSLEGLSDRERRNHWINAYVEQRKLSKSYGTMPNPIKRDNKELHNRSGGGGHWPTIRYPKLNRSKATWKKFYKLFPHAERRKKI